jgi:lipoprotein-anchoring transpeptidase ErfK/SrfK
VDVPRLFPKTLPTLAVSLCLVLAACGPGGRGAEQAGPQGDRTASATASATPTESAARVAISPAADTVDVRLDEPVTVSVADGFLTRVTVTGADGAPVSGAIGARERSWTSGVGLAPGTDYSVSATAVDARGLTTSASATFRTMTPKKTSSASVLPREGWTVGVGMPVIVDFGTAVKNREAVEKALTVTSTPAVSGAWRWFSSKQVQWRPADYWASGTTVTVRGDLRSTELAPGVWGKKDLNTTFEIGTAMVSTVNIAKHTMTVTRNGKVLKVIPITTGKNDPRFRTREGIKVIISRETSHLMNSETTGIAQDSPEGYNLTVKYAMRLTWSGEFLHAAPWSVGSQGRANVSHGCTGMSTANAKWLFDRSKVGDVVVYQGGSRKLEWGNGYTAWNMPFDQWGIAA